MSSQSATGAYFSDGANYGTTFGMKICILTERMKIGFGVDLVVDEQAKRLAARGHEVVIVVIHAEFVQLERDYRLVVINQFFGPIDYASSSAAASILSFSDTADADVYVLQTPPFYEWSRFLAAPVIFVEHGSPPSHFFSREIGRHIDSLVTVRLDGLYAELQDHDAIVSISHAIHDWLPPSAQAKSHVIYHGGDHYPVVEPREAARFREALGIGSDETLILWIGRMQLAEDEQPYKGFQELLNLVPLIGPHLGKARIVLAGRVSDDDRQALEAMGFLVLANCPSEELSLALAGADILINLSQWEGFNLALLEAQFQGTPVVAYDYGPHSEIVRDGVTGVLARNPQDFFRAVLSVANDRVVRERMAGEALLFARGFTWDRSVEQLEAVIEACVATAPSRDTIIENRRSAACVASGSSRSEDGVKIPGLRALLRLNGRAFVRSSYQAIIGRLPEEPQELSWFRALRKTGKTSVLRKMMRTTEARELAHRNPRLQNELSRHVWRSSFVRAWGRGKEWVRAAVLAPRDPLPDLQNEALIRHAFRVLLGREAEPAAVEGYTGLLRAGRSRKDVLTGIRVSEEGRRRPLTDPHFLRALKQDDRSRWLVLLDKTIQLATLGGSLPLTSWHRMDDEEFIRRAYMTLLGRPAEQEAVDRLVRQLRDGNSRRQILADLRFSDEGRARPLLDAELRSLLYIEKLRRSGLLHAVLKRLNIRSLERENASRQLRRLDSRQRALAADLARLAELVRQRDASAQVASAVERLAAIERAIGQACTGAATTVDQPRRHHFVEAPMSGSLRLGPAHVALVAPGTRIRTNALDTLRGAVRSGDCDIVMGDELVRADDDGSVTLRRHGPFQHETFLAQPDLGGIVCVHQGLLDRLRIPPTIALTGRVALALVARAHTVAYLPQVLCERGAADASDCRADLADICAYLAETSGAISVDRTEGKAFRISSKSTTPWTAAVIRYRTRRQNDTEHSDGAADDVRYQTALSLARSGDSAFMDASDGGSTIAWSDHSPSLSRLLNETVRGVPSECDLILIIHDEVEPAGENWLPRLAETALRPSVGVVAPKILYPDGRIRHAGIAAGEDGSVRYMARFERQRARDGVEGGRDDPPDGLRDVSAVSINCQMFRRSTFLDNGGFDERLSADAFDIDFCLSLRETSLAILVDERITLTQPDRNPRWARNLSTDVSTIVKDRHRGLFREGETASRSLAIDADVNGAKRMQIAILPMIHDR